jgi:hypothetical protein
LKLAILDQKNPSYDPDHWAMLAALAKGGKAFKALLSRFLPKNPAEPENVYAQRRQQAHYTSYVGAISNLYVSWLFAASVSPKAFKRGTETPIKQLPSFYGEFSESVCAETTLIDFMRDRFREALTTQKSHWLIEMPSDGGNVPENQSEYEQRGLGRATLRAIDREELFDWEADASGALAYAVLHTTVDGRTSFAEVRGATVTEIWRVYDAENCTTYSLTYKKGERPRDPEHEISQDGPAVPHGFHRVPMVSIEIPIELCIAEQTHEPQIEHFRLNNALSWLIRRTCYAQPVFKVADGDNLPVLGAGYAIVIGQEDDMGWTAPPNAPFDIIQNNVDNKRDEIYRVVHQMAQGLDNNAETVGRSADSKEIDAASTRIMLGAYAGFVCKAIEETYEIISEARNETEFEWSVEGFDGYDTATAASLLANTALAKSLSIRSKTFHKELSTKAALALLPGADQRMKDTIRKEINEADISVDSIENDALAAKAELERAKAKAEPIKAEATMKTASRPAPKPSAPAAKPKG